MSKLNIYREHKRDCFIISKDFLSNEELSWAAKGVLAYLLSLEDEQINTKELQCIIPDDCFNELVKNNYIITNKELINERKN